MTGATILRIAQDEVRRVAERVPEIETVDIQLDRATRRLGCWHHEHRTGRRWMTVSKFHTDEAVLRETVRHELAHMLAGASAGHNHVWRAMCRVVGAEPKRCASESLAEAKRRTRYVLECEHGCRIERQKLSKVVRAAMRDDGWSRYRCKRHQAELVLTESKVAR